MQIFSKLMRRASRMDNEMAASNQEVSTNFNNGSKNNIKREINFDKKKPNEATEWGRSDEETTVASDLVLLEEVERDGTYSASYQPYRCQDPFARSIHERLMVRLEKNLQRRAKKYEINILLEKEKRATKLHLNYLETKKLGAKKFIERRSRAVYHIAAQMEERRRCLEEKEKKRILLQQNRQKKIISRSCASCEPMQLANDKVSELKNRLEQRHSAAANRRQKMREEMKQKMKIHGFRIQIAKEKRRNILRCAEQHLLEKNIEAANRRLQILSGIKEKHKKQIEAIEAVAVKSKEELERRMNEWAMKSAQKQQQAAKIRMERLEQTRQRCRILALSYAEANAACC